MTESLELDLGAPAGHRGEGRDNVTDWCLRQFHDHYGDRAITKDGIWEYLYGVMHAPDWRERYRHDLQRNLPRVPLAEDFEAFRAAGRELMDLHIGYEDCLEWPVECLVDGQPDEGQADAAAYRIDRRMRWGSLKTVEDASGKAARRRKRPDHTVLCVNDRCQLTGIPAEAHDYTVSGRSPLQWAVASLQFKHDKKSGITDDPNGWHVWAADSDAFNLIRHLRRLVHVSVATARTVAALPPSLSE